jgi:mRNA interferase HigB
MRLLGTDQLEDKSKKYSKDILKKFAAWRDDVEGAHWKQPIEVKNTIPTARPIRNNRIIFDIMGNQYRIIVEIDYQRETVNIRWVGKHKDYDRINAETI